MHSLAGTASAILIHALEGGLHLKGAGQYGRFPGPDSGRLPLAVRSFASGACGFLSEKSLVALLLPAPEASLQICDSCDRDPLK